MKGGGESLLQNRFSLSSGCTVALCCNRGENKEKIRQLELRACGHEERKNFGRIDREKETEGLGSFAVKLVLVGTGAAPPACPPRLLRAVRDGHSEVRAVAIAR